MEVQDPKLSSSFYFADYDQLKSSFLSNKPLQESKIILILNPVALIVQCKTFQFCKAGKIVYKFIFYRKPFTQEACLV